MVKDRDELSSQHASKLRVVREDMMISKAELARRAGVSALTIDRIESGETCRMETKRKIVLALGLKLNERDKVFAPDAGHPVIAKATKRLRPKGA